MIETALKWFTTIVCCLILQTTLVPLIAIYGAEPDLLILALFFMGQKHGVLPGLYVGFFLGLGMDLYSPVMLGQNALAKTVTGFFAGLFNEKVMRADMIMKIIILALCLLIHDLIFSAVELLKNGNSLMHLFAGIFSSIFPRVIYTVILAFVVQFVNDTIRPNLKR